ncbi:MAG: hypothetical protein V3W41_19330 [Planctomycetota bacterium]
MTNNHRDSSSFRSPDDFSEFKTPECGLANEDLVAWYYGELGQEEAESVKAHVQACAFCDEESNALRQLTSTLDQWTTSPSPTATILSELNPPPPAKSAWTWWKPALVGLAAGLIGFIALCGFGASWEHREQGFVLSFGDVAGPIQPTITAPITKNDLRTLVEFIEDRQELRSYELFRTIEEDFNHSEERQEARLVNLALRFENSMRRDRETLSRMLGHYVETGETRARHAAALMVSRALDDNLHQISDFPGEER